MSEQALPVHIRRNRDTVKSLIRDEYPEALRELIAEAVAEEREWCAVLAETICDCGVGCQIRYRGKQ